LTIESKFTSHLILRDAAQGRGSSQDEAVSSRAGPPRAIAHIGCLFSDLVGPSRLSFFDASPDSHLHRRVFP
jgi:hypothetical protein